MNELFDYQNINQYKSIANLYDYEFSNIISRSKEIQFYKNYVKKLGGNILELACGTGIITLELLDLNCNIWALDKSDAMLSVLNEKLKTNKNALKLKVVQSDIKTFDLNVKFDLIIIPNLSFLVLLHEDDRIACLNCMKAHLKENGIIIFDVINFDKIHVKNLLGRSFKMWEKININKQLKIIKYIEYPEFLKKNQLLFKSKYLIVSLATNKEEEYFDYLAMTMVKINKLKNEVKKSGLNIEQIVSGKKGKFPNNNEVLFIIKN